MYNDISKENVISAIEREKIIAILRGIPKDKLLATVKALYDGGIRLLEITYSADKSVSDEETAEMIRSVAEEFCGKMFIGAGTVLTKKQVCLTKKAGGLFIISPNVDKSVIRETLKQGLISLPGALTPSEVAAAANYGAHFVKLFPISSLGPDYVKAVKAPLSNVKLLAVGGINESNMQEYLKAGACGFGIGANITDKNAIQNSEFEKVTLLAKKYADAVRECADE